MNRAFKHLVAVGVLVASAASAFGQSTVRQGGAYTSGHVPMYIQGGGTGSNPTIQDSGAASGATTPGVGVSELQITARGTGSAPFAAQGTGPLGTTFCQYDGPITSAAGYHYLCMSANSQGGGLLAYGKGGAASALPLSFNINGTTYQFPFTIGGIVGPGTTVIGHQALWANTVGTLLSDGGVPLSSPNSVTSGSLAVYSGTTGKILGELAFPGGTSNFLRADGTFAAPAGASITVGTTTVASATSNAILYSVAGTLQNIAPANNSVLITNGSGAPSLSTVLPSGLTLPNPTVTGTYTGSSTIPGTAIQANAISNSQMTTMANNRVKGNVSGGVTNPSDLTGTQVTALLDAFTGDSGSGGVKGAVPAPSAGDAAAGKVLGAGGTWTVPSGGNTKFVTPLDAPYNAACNGSTDDSIALQSWLTGIAGNAATGWVPAGKTCIFNGLLSITSNTTIYGYGATFKVKNSGNANVGITWGPTSQLGGPVDNVKIFGLTMDGNRANQTNSAGSAALYYVISTTRTVLRDTRAINGRADGLYVGGFTNGGGQGRSSFVTVENHESNGNYRNGVSVVGLDRGNIIGGFSNSNNNTNNDGPQCGYDFEPDAGGFSNNSNINVWGISAASNGGTLSTTGGSGICVFGTIGNTTNLTITDVTSSSNQRYGIDQAAGGTAANVRLKSIGGVSNGTALVNTANAVDYVPLGMFVGAANSCTAGFRCLGIPN